MTNMPKLAARRARAATPTIAPQTPPTTSAIGARILALLTQTAETNIRIANEQLAKWGTRFASDPSHAFEWSKESFESAARHRIAKDILILIEMGLNGDEYAKRSDIAIAREIKSMLHDEVIRGAKWPQRSTSPQSNEMQLCLNAQRAEWLETIQRLFDRHEG